MQNSDSYVAQGRDNTGAAIQLTPFDSKAIWAAHDYQPKKPLLDSLGKDIVTSSGAVHPNDRRYVTDLKNKWIDKSSRLQAESARSKSDITPEQRKEVDMLKMETIDMTSLLQKQYEAAKQLEAKAKADPYSYPNWQEKINEYFALPPLERGLSPNVEKAPDVDLNKFFGDLGTAERSGGNTINRADGSSSGSTYTKFDPVVAKQNFNDIVVPVLNSGTPEANRVIASLEKDVRKLAELQKLDYTKLSDVDKMSLVLDVAEDQYMAAQKAKVHTRNTSTSSEANPEKVVKVKAVGGGSNKEDFGVNAGLAYINFTPEGEINSERKILPIGSNAKAGQQELVPFASIPIAGRVGGKNDAFAQKNKEIKLFDSGVPFTGTLDKISVYGNPKGEWQDGFWAVMSNIDKYGEPVVKQIFIDENNKDIIEKEYDLNIQEVFDKHPNWKEIPSKMKAPEPEKDKDWESLEPEKRQARKNAWIRKYGKPEETTKKSDKLKDLF